MTEYAAAVSLLRGSSDPSLFWEFVARLRPTPVDVVTKIIPRLLFQLENALLPAKEAQPTIWSALK